MPRSIQYLNKLDFSLFCQPLNPIGTFTCTVFLHSGKLASPIKALDMSLKTPVSIPLARAFPRALGRWDNAIPIPVF